MSDYLQEDAERSAEANDYYKELMAVLDAEVPLSEEACAIFDIVQQLVAVTPTVWGITERNPEDITRRVRITRRLRILLNNVAKAEELGRPILYKQIRKKLNRRGDG